MDFQRRLQLYLVGLVIGGLLAWFFMGDRLTNMAWTPKERIELRLENTLLKATPEADSTLRAWNTTLADLRAAMPEAGVTLKDTRRSNDSLYYAVTAEVKGRPLAMTIAVLADPRSDSTATLWELRDR